jgi:hypothetical protein
MMFKFYQPQKKEQKMEVKAVWQNGHIKIESSSGCTLWALTEDEARSLAYQLSALLFPLPPATPAPDDRALEPAINLLRISQTVDANDSAALVSIAIRLLEYNYE